MSVGITLVKDPNPITLLKARAVRAVAWGVPDIESTGMPHKELCTIISQLLAYIQQLEAINRGIHAKRS